MRASLSLWVEVTSNLPLFSSCGAPHGAILPYYATTTILEETDDGSTAMGCTAENADRRDQELPCDDHHESRPDRARLVPPARAEHGEQFRVPGRAGLLRR